jgi:hypothetical protein
MKTKILVFLTLLFIIGCDSSPEETNINSSSDNTEDNSGSNSQNGDWTISKDQVIDGGSGIDGIPSLDNPNFLNASDPEVNNYMDANDLIIGLVYEGEIKAYPHRILDWHEIVNDEINNQKIVINYCPLTGTGFGWRGNFSNLNTNFGVSGLLYNTNLILYDRETQSYWSQLKLEAINGAKIRTKPELISVVETTWGNWKNMYPQTKILSNSQAINRNYAYYPYGPYKEEHDLLFFPVTPLNQTLPLKQRVHAIIENNRAYTYKFNNFSNGNILTDSFNSKNILIVGNNNTIVSFELNSNQTSLVFTYAYNNSEIFFSDNEGNKWSVTGIAIEGPRIGERLTRTSSLMSYWFAIASFYPNPTLR